jgi:hypothetical protein
MSSAPGGAGTVGPGGADAPRPRRLLRLALWLAALAALAAVALSYLNPHRMHDLATRLWACF